MKIRLLYIAPDIKNSNGIASYVMNHLKHIDKSKFEIDVLTDKISDENKLLVENGGGKVLIAPPLKYSSYFKYIKQAKKIFRENDYDIVHSHTFNWTAPYLKEAKKRNVAVRILHSHATQSSEKLHKRIRNSFLIRSSLKNANFYWACSKEAGVALFKKRDFYVSDNAIESDKYIFSEEYRASIRKELHLSDTKRIIGFVGRFSHQKNVFRFIEIAKSLKKISSDFSIIMIGNGPLKVKMRENIIKAQLEEFFIILNSRDDVYRYYSVFDVFLLPSLFEGLPIVGIETIFSNLPGVYSDTITNEFRVSEHMTFMSLKMEDDVWAKTIFDSVIPTSERKIIPTLAKKYDINNAVIAVMNEYTEALKFKESI